jgi:cell division topological specificity factor
MNFLNFLKFPGARKSAKIAKERLQIVLSHQHFTGMGNTDFLPALRNELLMVISKYVNVDKDQINVQLQHNNSCSVLELNITLPSPALEEL